MKRIIEIAQDVQGRLGVGVCVSLEVWIYDSKELAIEWALWDGKKNRRFKSLAEISEHINPSQIFELEDV